MLKLVLFVFSMIFIQLIPLIPFDFVHYSLNQRAPARHESVETPIGNESNGVVDEEGANFIVILFQYTCGFHNKFGEVFCHFTNSFSCFFYSFIF